MKTFASMRTNVGNIVGDTSTALNTIIGGWVNDAYNDIWRRFNWSDTINNDKTITLVSGTASYDLPLDFETEINCVDITDGFLLRRYTERAWWQERGTAYSGGTITNGTSSRYVILREKVNSSGSGFGVVIFDPTPDNTHTIAFPYKRKCQNLIAVSGTCSTDTASKVIDSSATFITSNVEPGMRIKNTSDGTYGIITSVDTNTQLTCETDVCPDGNEDYEIFTYPVIRDIEYAIECGAASMAFAYKHNFSKASDYLQKYEYEIQRRITEENSRPNQLNQWIPESAGPNNDLRPFTGWESYA
jgi:hypothetical protein